MAGVILNVSQGTVAVWDAGSEVPPGAEQLRATLNRDSMSGIITADNASWQATRAPDDVL